MKCFSDQCYHDDQPLTVDTAFALVHSSVDRDKNAVRHGNIYTQYLFTPTGKSGNLVNETTETITFFRIFLSEVIYQSL